LLAGTNGIIVVALLAAFVTVISAAIVKKVFCTSQLVAAANKSLRDSEEESATKT